MSTNPEFLFAYDIESWLADKNNKTLNQFKLDKKRTISFQFSRNDSELIRNEVERQNIHSGMGQVLKNIPLQKQFRKPKAISQNL